MGVKVIHFQLVQLLQADIIPGRPDRHPRKGPFGPYLSPGYKVPFTELGLFKLL